MSQQTGDKLMRVGLEWDQSDSFFKMDRASEKEDLSLSLDLPVLRKIYVWIVPSRGENLSKKQAKN